jgi:hypothetical protein
MLERHTGPNIGAKAADAAGGADRVTNQLTVKQ